VIEASGIDPKLIEDIYVGNVLPPKGGATICRMAQLHAGIPQECTLATVNRQCSSGLQAISVIANAISSGDIDIGIGAGAESMSNHYIAPTLPPGQKVDTLIFVCV
jgi:acetyl-CoA acyltransferase 1